MCGVSWATGTVIGVKRQQDLIDRIVYWVLLPWAGLLLLFLAVRSLL